MGRSLPLYSSVLLILSGRSANAFSTSCSSSRSIHAQQFSNAAPAPINNGRRSLHHSQSTMLFESTPENESPTSDTTAEMTELEAAQTRETPQLTSEDKSFVTSLYIACNSDGNDANLQDEITANLENMHPRLVVALQMAAENQEWKEDDVDEEFETQMIALGNALQTVLNTSLKSGREMLATLLNSGEIRKLDSTIGKAAKDGQLDMSFFSVLSMNIKDAAVANSENGGSAVAAPTLAAGEGQEEVEGEEGQPTGANRLQILQHIYTRCQEELEKNVDPGMGLLNKLLRTEISSIRSNQLNHYLGPQATSITSPDGQVIELAGSTAEPMVSHTEFTDALSSTVDQIRTLEGAGGTDRLSAMNLVESVRQVAMEARVVLVDAFGEGSEVVSEFQRDLQPVFRPGSKVP